MGAGLVSARNRLLAADLDDAPTGRACEQVVEAFREVTRFAAAAVMTVDPETLLPSGGVVEGFTREDCAPFWENELLDPDFNKFAALARSIDPVATLADAVDGDLLRSPRYAKLYAATGAADELRVAFVSGSTCFGVGVFVRASQDGPFPRSELAEVRSLIPAATSALRRTLGRIFPDAADQAPVVIILDGQGNVTGMSAGGQQALDELRLDGVDSDVPGVIQIAATKARSSRATTHVTTRVRGRSGRWVRLDVSPMEGQAGAVALTVETAASHEIVGILLDSYGLTPRETDIVLRLCRGQAIKEIADGLIISAHTVRDHIKAIYRKANVNSRGELVAKLFSNHVLDRFHDSVAHVAQAS